MSDTHVTTVQQSGLSVGAGLAIAGAWLASSALSALIILVLFVWSPFASAKVDVSNDGSAFTALIILVLLIGAPLIGAYSLSKMIINNQAD